MPKKAPTETTPADSRSTGQSIQVIARAASVLRALEGEQSGLSLAQIAQRVNLARSTVQRIVDALRAEQFVIAATPTSGVRLGPALIRLAASASVEFDLITRPLMAKLSQKLGETVDLSVLKGFSAIFTDQVQGAHRLRAVSPSLSCAAGTTCIPAPKNRPLPTAQLAIASERGGISSNSKLTLWSRRRLRISASALTPVSLEGDCRAAAYRRCTGLCADPDAQRQCCLLVEG